MKPGKIGVADHDGVNVIKMSGDVRLTLCLSFDAYIEDMFASDNFCAVIFDLTEAEAIDSTTLGLMAKISLLAKARGEDQPTILSTAAGINRLLECMGFAEIFTIVDSMAETLSADVCLPEGDLDECRTKTKVIEAHKILMDLNDKNANTFRDLVNTLENC